MASITTTVGRSRRVQRGDIRLKTNLLNVTPTTGQTVSYTSNNYDQFLQITPAAGLAALTIAVPANTDRRVGQILQYAITKSVTTTTWSGAGTFNNMPGSFNANDCAAIEKTGDNIWSFVQ